MVRCGITETTTSPSSATPMNIGHTTSMARTTNGVATPLITKLLRISKSMRAASNAHPNANMEAVARRAFLVIENPVGGALIAGNCTVHNMDLTAAHEPHMKIMAFVTVNAMTEIATELYQESRGLTQAQAPSKVHISKRTYPPLLDGVTDFSRSFFPVAILNPSQTHYACSSHYPKSARSHSTLSWLHYTTIAPRQWPFFAETPYSVSLYSFDLSVVLPFKELVWQDQPASSSRHGFGCVSKVFLHPAHHNFYDVVPENTFALKKLKSKKMEDFKREVRALRKFAAYPNDHVVRLLVAFRHDKSFYLIFPWAQGGSLRSFWRAHPQPTVYRDTAIWVAKQSLGIAAALHAIHHENNMMPRTPDHNGDHQGVAFQVRGYHGDIKAENILLFESGRCGDRHVWKIGDFGVSNRFLVASQRGDIPCGFTPTYQSPEHRMEGRIDDSADIWSLGCVFLETVIWLVDGWDALISFGMSRRNEGQTNDGNEGACDSFFDIRQSDGDQLVPVLKPSVLQYIEQLSSDPRVSPYLQDILHLIRHYLLDVNKESRLSSEVLVRALHQIYERCIDMPAYTVVPPRPRKPPLLKKTAHCENSPRCVAGPLASRDLSIYNIVSRKNSALAAPKDIISQKNTSSRHIAVMAFGQSVPGDSQWLDDFISHHQPNSVPGSGLSSFVQEDQAPPRLFQTESSQEAQFTAPSPKKAQSGQRRGFNSITSPGDGDSNGRVKRRRREGALSRRAREITPHTPKDYSASGADKGILSPPRPPAAVSKSKMFACPFSKRAGERHITTRDWKCCLGSGPGWTIHRLKEHLYRKHAFADFLCSRCFTEFDTHDGLTQHQRREIPCRIQSDNRLHAEKIDTHQVGQLKKKSRSIPDEEKWNDIYRIVFRLHSTAEVPSPYYEDIVPIPDRRPASAQGDDSLLKFQSYLQDLLLNAHETRSDASEFRTGLNLIQGFLGARGDLPLPLSEVPSLTFDHGAFSAVADQQEASTMSTIPDISTVETSPGFLGGDGYPPRLDGWDPAFDAQLDQTFNDPTSQFYMPPWGFQDSGG